MIVNLRHMIDKVIEMNKKLPYIKQIANNEVEEDYFNFCVDELMKKYTEDPIKHKSIEKMLNDDNTAFAFPTLQDLRDEIDDIEAKNKKLELEIDAIIWELVNTTNNKLDRFKLPKSIKSIDLTEEDWDAVRTKVKENMIENNEPQVEEQILDTMVDSLSIVIPMVQEQYGDKFQGLLRERVIEKIAVVTYKQESAKAGKPHSALKERNERIAEALQPYWNWKINDITMPDNHNVDSLFTEIGKNEGLSFERIKQLERELKEKYAPQELDINDDYPR